MRPGFRIKPLLVGEHLVPDVPAAAEGLLKQLSLGRGRTETDLERCVPKNLAVCGLRFPRHFPHTSVCSGQVLYNLAGKERGIYRAPHIQNFSDLGLKYLKSLPISKLKAIEKGGQVVYNLAAFLRLFRIINDSMWLFLISLLP